MTDDTHRSKSRLQRLDPKAWIGYLVGYQASTIYRIWIPSLAKVISTRDVIFDENTIFDGKVEDLMDSLMHSTLLEIAAYVRTIELPHQSRTLGRSRFMKMTLSIRQKRPTNQKIHQATTWEEDSGALPNASSHSTTVHY
ncbi:polyprotein [Pyrenophora tritici-repentis]|nr:polyprotein [Pyrenophora tritici-repentis]